MKPTIWGSSPTLKQSASSYQQLVLIPYLPGYKTGVCPSRMSSNDLISPMKFCNNTNFTIPKQSQRSRSVLQDGSRSLGLFWKEKNSVLQPKKYSTLVPGPILQLLYTEHSFWTDTQVGVRTSFYTNPVRKSLKLSRIVTNSLLFIPDAFIHLAYS